MISINVRVNEKHGELRTWTTTFFRSMLDKVLNKNPVVRERRWIDWRPVTGRREVHCDVIRMNRRTVIVRLPNGHVIKRKLARDLV